MAVRKAISAALARIGQTRRGPGPAAARQRPHRPGLPLRPRPRPSGHLGAGERRIPGGDRLMRGSLLVAGTTSDAACSPRRAKTASTAKMQRVGGRRSDAVCGDGLGLLPVATRFAAGKTLRRPSGYAGTIAVTGYEIHHDMLAGAVERHLDTGALLRLIEHGPPPACRSCHPARGSRGRERRLAARLRAGRGGDRRRRRRGSAAGASRRGVRHGGGSHRAARIRRQPARGAAFTAACVTLAPPRPPPRHEPARHGLCRAWRPPRRSPGPSPAAGR